MKNLPFFIISLLFFSAFAQRDGAAKIDSLLAELPNTKPDTAKINLLNRLANLYQGNNADEGFKYAKEALALSVKLNWKKGIMDSKTYLGRLYWRKGDFEKALLLHNEAKKIAGELNDKIMVAYITRYIGQDYADGGNYPEALKYLEKSIAIFDETDVRDEIASCYLVLAWIYSKQGNFPMSYKANFDALKTAEAANDAYGVAVASSSIAIDYFKLDRHEEAIPYLVKANEHFLKTGAYINLSDNYNALVTAYSWLENFPQALKYAMTAIENAKGIKNAFCTGESFNSLASVYFIQNKFAEAAACYESSIKNFRSANAYHLLADNYSRLSICFIKLNQKAMAKDALDSAAYYGKQIDSRTVLTGYLSGKQLYDSLAGNWKDAYFSHYYYTHLRDSLYNAENTRKMLQSQVQYDFDKKEAAAKAEREKKDVRQKILRSTMITGLAGTLLFLVVVFRQRNKISKEKKIAEQQRHRAEQSEKFKQQFLANMSHEIRTPMNAIMGMTELVLNTPLNDRQKKYLTSAKNASDNLLHIINDILDLSKMEAGKIELEQIHFPVRELVEQVGLTLKHKADEKDIALLTDIDSGIPEILVGDPMRLTQVLINLAGNAIKFTEKGSVVIAVALNGKLQSSIFNLQFSITDTGIGIPADKLDKIFESFSQAHSSDSRKYGGTGLGLTISRQFIELMHGKLKVESREGSGSVFSFGLRFPVGSKERLLQQNSSEEIDGSILDGLKILVVDDNADNRIVCRDTLESKADVKIAEAANGKEAIDILQNSSLYWGTGSADIILMDVQMPVMDGYEATRQIRNPKSGIRNPEIPIIALTASVIKSDLDKCKQAGMDDYVPKPFKAHQLISAIAKLTNRKIKFASTHKDKSSIKAAAQGTIGKSSDLTYLEEFCEGDKSKMQKYITIFLDSAPVLTENLNRAVAKENFAEIASKLHAFKTKFVMMGMEDAKEFAMKIENNCRMEQPAGDIIQSDLKELLRMIRDAINELRLIKIS